MILLVLIAIAVLIVADQAVKLWTVAQFAAPVPPNIYATADAPVDFLPGVVELTRIHNYGAAWSSFSGMRWVLVALTGAVMVFLLVVLFKKWVRHPLGLAGLTLILSGGIGNLIDRVRLGYVVDMLHLEFWPSYPVFNVADIFVVSGVIIFMLYYLFLYEKTDSRAARLHDKED